jgi:hypothetical protein
MSGDHRPEKRMRGFVLAVLLFGVLLPVSGCGGSTERRAATTDGSSSCDSISPQPITQKHLVAAMAKHGIDLYPDPNYTDCTDFTGRTLTNLVGTGSHENRAHWAEIETREGQVFCSADPKPLSQKSLKRVREFEIREDKTEFVYANVICDVYTTKDDREAALARMRPAMATLAAGAR